MASRCRVVAPQVYPAIKKLIEEIVASGLIYLPSGARDLNNPILNRYLAKYVRGSGGMDHVDRIKILKLLRGAIGIEFGGRHELYEINYAGSQDEIRMQCLRQAQRGPAHWRKLTAMVDRCSCRGCLLFLFGKYINVPLTLVKAWVKFDEHDYWVDKRVDKRTALLLDAAIQAASSHGIVGAAFELFEQGVPLETVSRVLTKPAERRHYPSSIWTQRGSDGR